MGWLLPQEMSSVTYPKVSTHSARCQPSRGVSLDFPYRFFWRFFAQLPEDNAADHNGVSRFMLYEDYKRLE
jgi:hypothetical protein